MLENIRNQLLSLFLLAVIFLVFSLLFLFLADPQKISVFMLAGFYISLAGFLVSFFTLILYLFKLGSAQLHSRKIAVAARQSLWLTLLIISSLILSAHQLFYWWLEVILILTLIMFEGFFLSSNT
jgi:hypothetical protein